MWYRVAARPCSSADPLAADPLSAVEVDLTGSARKPGEPADGSAEAGSAPLVKEDKAGIEADIWQAVCEALEKASTSVGEITTRGLLVAVKQHASARDHTATLKVRRTVCVSFPLCSCMGVRVYSAVQ